MADRFQPVTFKQFDQVQIKTTRNVKYLSAPAGTEVTPQGVWSVVAVVGAASGVGSGQELILAKQNAIVRIPVADVLKVADYNTDDFTRPLGRLLDG